MFAQKLFPAFIITCSLLAAPLQAAPASTPVVSAAMTPATKSATPAPVVATTPAPVAPAAVATITTPPEPPEPPLAAIGHAQPQSLEERLNALHEKLHLTAATEKLWGDVSKAMLETQKNQAAVVPAATQPLTAPETIKLAQKMVELRSAGLKKLLPAVETLYQSLNAAQRKQLDSDLMPPIRSMLPARHP